MLAKLIRRIKCCSVQEILMIVSIIMLLTVSYTHLTLPTKLEV